jgi:hypothetical protein
MKAPSFYRAFSRQLKVAKPIEKENRQRRWKEGDRIVFAFVFDSNEEWNLKSFNRDTYFDESKKYKYIDPSQGMFLNPDFKEKMANQDIPVFVEI